MNTYAQNTTLQPGLYQAGPGVTLGGTQINDTFKAIKIVEELKNLDGQLKVKGVPESEGDLLLDYDDIVIVDKTGAETNRLKGRL